MMTLGEAAVWYAERGFAVFPIGPRGKMPLISKADGGSGFLDATDNMAQVREWWEAVPDANVGIALGRASHDLVVVDIDGAKGQATIRDRELHLPQTVLARTGREDGGWHYYFVAAGMAKGKINLLPGVDVKAGDGYVVAPPSVHENGNQYKWQWRPGQIPFEVAPSWLIDEMRKQAGSGGTPSPEQWVAFTGERYTVGRRHFALIKLAGKVFCSDLAPRIGAELLLSWNQMHCDPPLPAQEAQRLIRDIAQAEKDKL